MEMERNVSAVTDEVKACSFDMFACRIVDRAASQSGGGRGGGESEGGPERKGRYGKGAKEGGVRLCKVESRSKGAPRGPKAEWRPRRDAEPQSVDNPWAQG